MHTRYLHSALAAALVVAAFSLATANGTSAADGTMTWGVPMRGNEVPVASAGDEQGRARLARSLSEKRS